MSPVPPYKTPIEVVAPTTPFRASSGPFKPVSVTVDENVFAPEKTLVE